MRLLLLTDWNLLQGGAEVYIEWLRDGLRAAGDEVELLTSSVSPRARQSAEHLAFASESMLAKAALQIVNPFAAARVREAVRAFRPDAAFVNMFALYLSPAALFALGDVPFVLAITDYKCICPMGTKLLPDETLCTRPAGVICLRAGCLSLPHWLRDQARYALMRGAMRRAAQVIACSKSLQATLAEHGIAAELESQPVPAPSADFSRVPTPHPSFVYVGRLDPEKGVDTLVRAFALLRESVPEARLRIVGQGSRRDSLEALASKLAPEAISFRGWLEPARVEEELRDAWALVVPSRWVEPLGLVALEAIVRGIPAIVSDNGGLAETVDHGVSGLRFPAESAQALAACMLEVASGRVFGARGLDPQVAARARTVHGVGEHVRRMRARFEQVRRRARGLGGLPS